MNKKPIRFKEKSKETLPTLITENKNTQPILGLEWLDKLEIGLQGSKKTNVIRHIEEDEKRKKIISEHEDLFKNNHTIKDLTIDIQLKKDAKPIQQKGRPVPIHIWITPMVRQNCRRKQPNTAYFRLLAEILLDITA